MAAGQAELAIEAAGRALELRRNGAGAKRFSLIASNLCGSTADDGRFRRLVLRALSEGWARPRELAGVCISLIKLNRAVNDGIARADSAWPARLPATELFGASAMAALSQEQLLCRLLECDPVTDIGLERLLTNVRHAMLDERGGRPRRGRKPARFLLRHGPAMFRQRIRVLDD